MEKANFWSGESFVVKDSKCIGIQSNGLNVDVSIINKRKDEKRIVLLPFPKQVSNDQQLKRTLIEMVYATGRLQDTARAAMLEYGDNHVLPVDFRWNEVPHQSWVRSYLYESATNAVVKALTYGNNELKKSRMKVSVNFPEVNPAFDTYRIGTLLEMIRHLVLVLTCDEGKRVRVCVQQSLGEGVFAGMPLALSSMRPTLERMDWGQKLRELSAGGTAGEEGFVRFGAVGADQVKDDDDIIIVIAPQNVVGGMIIDLLEGMVKKANGRPVILFNPLLYDRPSANNMMQVQGRSERRDFADSFKDVYTLRLLYPSGGGYMYPIRGMLVQADVEANWALYAKDEGERRETYRLIGAFPPGEEPAGEDINELFRQANRQTDNL